MNPDTHRFEREESRQILIGGGSALAVRRWARALGRALRQKELVICRVGKMHRIAMPRPR